jgi:hypothetical protein
VKLSSFFAWTRTTRCRWSTTSSASPSAPLCSDVSSSIQPSFQRARLCAPSALVLVHLPSTPVLWARPFLSRSFSTCCATSTLRFPKTLHRRMNDYAQSYIVCPSVVQKNCTSKSIVDHDSHTREPPLTRMKIYSSVVWRSGATTSNRASAYYRSSFDGYNTCMFAPHESSRRVSTRAISLTPDFQRQALEPRVTPSAETWHMTPADATMPPAFCMTDLFWL